MNITLKAKNTTLTPAIRNFVNEKLEGFSKFIKEEDKIRVEVEYDKRDKDGLHFRAEIDIQPHGYFADAKGTDLYEAFDLVVPKMKEQLSKKKDKAVSLRRKVGRRAKNL